MRKGEIHALLRNGAGKSTPDEYMLVGLLNQQGDIVVNGNTVNLDSPSKAALGIEWHQHLCWLKPSLLLKISSLAPETTKHGVLTLKASQDILDLSKNMAWQ